MQVKNIIVYNDYGHIYGGAGKIAFDSALALAQKGFHVVFFCATGPVDSQLEAHGIEVVFLNQADALSDKNKMASACRNIWNRKAYRESLKCLAQYSPQDTVVMVHGYVKTLSASIFSTFRKRQFKTILTLHDYFTACPNGGFFNYQKNACCTCKAMSTRCVLTHCDSRNYAYKLYRCVRQSVLNHCLRRAKKYIHAYAVSKLCEEKLRPYVTQFATKSGVLYNPVIRLLDHPVDISRNNAFLYIGRLSEEKGIHDFCKVMTELQLQGIVLGDGYLLDDLKHQYPNITFAGWVNGNDKMAYLKQAKCLVFPSKVNETFGLSVAEMLSIGVPCIVPLACGAVELIRPHGNGLTYKMGDYDGLKAAVEQFNQTEIATWAARMATQQLPDFSMEGYLKNLQNIFFQL